jgi:hypothetical protein
MKLNEIKSSPKSPLLPRNWKKGDKVKAFSYMWNDSGKDEGKEFTNLEVLQNHGDGYVTVTDGKKTKKFHTDFLAMAHGVNEGVSYKPLKGSEPGTLDGVALIYAPSERTDNFDAIWAYKDKNVAKKHLKRLQAQTRGQDMYASMKEAVDGTFLVMCYDYTVAPSLKSMVFMGVGANKSAIINALKDHINDGNVYGIEDVKDLKQNSSTVKLAK